MKLKRSFFIIIYLFLESILYSKELKEESAWTLSGGIFLVSDDYFRGISQSWHQPALQGSFDISHSVGFYTGIAGSTISPNTYPDATLELDYYLGYNGTAKEAEGFGYTFGLYGYFYPNGSWTKYNYHGVSNQTPNGGAWDTYEANFGLSYKWFNSKISITLNDWFGANQNTGFQSRSVGTTYMELNLNIPLGYDFILINHLGYLDVKSKLDLNIPSSQNIAQAESPDYYDFKFGVTKAFPSKTAKGEWVLGVYVVGATNGGGRGYWGVNGFGGSSFNGSFETKDLAKERLLLSVGRTF